MKKIQTWALLFMLGILLAGTEVYALGVSPAIVNIEFQPSTGYEGTFTLYNSMKEPLRVTFAKQGGLAADLTVPGGVTINPFSQQIVQYHLSLPQNLPPGFHTVSIIATQQAPAEAGETQIGATVAVLTNIRVFAPYPEKYPVMEMIITEHPGSLEVKIPVMNLGNEDIKSSFATVRLKSRVKEVSSSTTGAGVIPAKQRRDLIAALPLPEPGAYEVEATMHYDGREKVIMQQWVSAQKSLHLQEIKVEGRLPRGLTKVILQVDNAGRDERTNVIAELTMTNSEGKEVARLNSPAISLASRDSKMIELWWEDASLPEGVYNMIIRVRSSQETIEKQAKLEITAQNIKVMGSSAVAGQTTAFQQGTGSVRVHAWGMGAIFLLIAVIVVVMIRNHARKAYK